MSLDLLVADTRRFLDNSRRRKRLPGATLRRSLHDAWFADTLAWLLDPKGRHGLGVRFAEDLVKVVAQTRASGRYPRRPAHLKWGKAGAGRGGTHFAFGDASVIRSLPLGRQAGSGVVAPHPGDLAFVDLAATDSLVLVILSRIFGTNHSGELVRHVEATERDYRHVQVREYVYLSLLGSPPVVYPSDEGIHAEDWLRLSWLGHVRPVLEELVGGGGAVRKPRHEVLHLLRVLRWLSAMAQPPDPVASHAERLGAELVGAVAECLCEELEHLSSGWSLRRRDNHHIHLCRPPDPPVVVEMEPGLGIVALWNGRSREPRARVVAPFGVHPIQLRRLVALVALDVHRKHVGGPRPPITTSTGEAFQRFHDLFDFVFRYRFELQVLLSGTAGTWRRVADDEPTEQLALFG